MEGQEEDNMYQEIKGYVLPRVIELMLCVEEKATPARASVRRKRGGRRL